MSKPLTTERIAEIRHDPASLFRTAPDATFAESLKRAHEELRALCDAALRGVEDGERRFPLLDGPSIPWSALAPFEGQAQRNHSQSLERLAERGGLSVQEAIHVLECERWYTPRSKEINALAPREAVLHLHRLIDAARSPLPQENSRG